MSRLVLVANRVPNPRDRGATAGGLAVALKDAVARRDAMWFGWSGHTAERTAETPEITRERRLTYATLDLGQQDYQRYYQGFSNATLWPTLHYRLGLARFVRDEYCGYRNVNAAFARSLMPLLVPDDEVWVHDFHLFPLGAELRRRGARHRIGFFLHVPFPPRALWSVLPRSGELLADLAAYDVIGLQTEEDAENLRDALVHAGHPDAASRVAAFAIGIDAAGFIAAAEKSARAPETARLMDSLGGRHLLIGVDRLDYTKGLPQRFAGYAQLLARFPRHRGKVTYLQVAPVSRGDVAQYRALRRELDEWAGRINGQHAEFDWAPLRYLTRAVPRSTLAGFMRRARVGVVTPLRDGMNLVAKEYVAAQDPEDPGTLVLSRFAGAAQELDGALLVNPMDPDEIAEALDAALVMPLDERVDRWARMSEAVHRSTAAAWCRHFLAALESAEPRASTAVAAAPAAAALRTRPWRRSAGYARG